MKLSIFLGILAFHIQIGYAQDFQLLKNQNLNYITQVSQDRYGNVYVVEQEGTIHQLDSLGREVVVYSPSMIAEVSLFEARSTVRLLVFYRDLQSFTLLNRFLTPIEHYKFENDNIGFVRLATLSADNQLWLLDDVNFSLKKFDKNLNIISLKTPLDLLFVEKDYDINYLCEYQNQLFLNDKTTGILIFDNLGNFKQKIPLKKSIDFFSFLDEEIYFLEDGTVRFLHLYNLSERTMTLPQAWKTKAKKVICQKQRLFLFGEREMAIFRY
ncbi:MAG: hypothetical protein MUE81_21775 [Thermoflexibacter sp.]|nr:hypothetical protein [Thermoflexibacter sp.]